MKTTSASRLFLLSEGVKGSGGNLSGNGSTLLTLNFISSFIFYFVFNFDLHNGTIKAKNWINPHPPCSHLFHRSREKAQPPHPAFSNGIFPLGGILLLEGTGLNCSSHLSLGWNQFHGSTWPDKPTFTSPGNSHPFPPCPTCPGFSRTTQLMSKHGGIIGRREVGIVDGPRAVCPMGGISQHWYSTGIFQCPAVLQSMVSWSQKSQEKNKSCPKWIQQIVVTLKF